MELEGIIIDRNCEREFKQLPYSFINLNTSKINVSKNSTQENKLLEISVEQRDKEIPAEINIPTTAKDIKITIYGRTTFTEFYYKKTNYLVRY